MTSETRLVPVEVPMVGDPRHKHWAKVVFDVDPTKSSGWAFVGDFIASGGIQDVPAGAVLLVYGEKGARSNPQIEAQVFSVNPDATLSRHATAGGRAWARTLRDTVEQLLQTERPTHVDWERDLEAYSDGALADELRRRGWSVDAPQRRETG